MLRITEIPFIPVFLLIVPEGIVIKIRIYGGGGGRTFNRTRRN